MQNDPISYNIPSIFDIQFESAVPTKIIIPCAWNAISPRVK